MFVLAMLSFCVHCLRVQVHVLFCYLAFGCQYQCSRLPVKSLLQNDLVCVDGMQITAELSQTV